MIGERLRKIIQPLLLMFCILKKEKTIYPAYVSKINSNCEKRIILFMIPNKEKEGWHYPVLKKLFALPIGINSKHNDELLIELPSFFSNRKLHEKVCKNRDFGITMRSRKDNILECHEYMKSDKIPHIFYRFVNSKNRPAYSLRVFNVNNFCIL